MEMQSQMASINLIKTEWTKAPIGNETRGDKKNDDGIVD